MLPYDPRDDHYATIGVAENASADEIKRAYREKAKLLHPDGHRNPELATRATQQLNAAYAVLSDSVKRRDYDEQRAALRLRENEVEIQRRVAEALARMNRIARPARGQSEHANTQRAANAQRAEERLRKSREQAEERVRKSREKAEERQRQAQERAEQRRRALQERADKRRARTQPKTPLGLVPKRQLGVFSRLAESKVDGLLRDDRTFDAVLLGVGAAMLDAWLGPTPRRPR